MSDEEQRPLVDVPEEELEKREESLIKFPARFSIKAMGHNNAQFRSAVQEIIERLIPPQDFLGSTESLSKNGKYVSITLTALFYAKPSIDRVYVALSESPLVLMAL